VTIALPFLLALLVSATLVPIYRGMALRLGYVVASSGGQPMPKAKARAGGVPIAVALFGCAIVVGSFESVPVLLLCSTALFLVGIGTDILGALITTEPMAGARHCIADSTNLGNTN
jgi:UDP-N-acetylmuramyl pentapeptide phosphotransferase/UDP-N-acetylglucosamine-1-phosphate transferase